MNEQAFFIERLTPMQAIRKKCLDCSANQYQEIKACPVVKCPIWKFRLGLHPYTQKNLENPFLQPSYFIGLEKLTSDELIKNIKEKTKTK